MSIVASRNIFLDSEFVPYGNGDSFRVALPPSQFSCKANQIMRMTLTNFEIRRNWYAVNQTNNVFFIYDPTPAAGLPSGRLYPCIIPPGSYRAYAPASGLGVLTTPVTTASTPYGFNTPDLASAIKYALDKTLFVLNAGGTITDSNGKVVNNISYAATNHFTGTPSSTVTWNPVTRKFRISFPQLAAGRSPDLHIVCFQLKTGAGILPDTLEQFLQNANPSSYGDWSFQDCFELLGGIPTRNVTFRDALTRTPTTVTAASTLTFLSPYVGQLNTVEALYVRLSSSSTNNYQSPSLERDLSNDYVVCPTNIFARIPLPTSLYDETDDLISYSDTGASMFQTLLDVQQMNVLQCSLTDDKNRPISEVLQGQAIDGALAYKMTLKWEVIQMDHSLTTAPASMDVISSLSPAGFVRPTSGMQSSSYIPTVSKPMRSSMFAANGVGKALP